MKKLIKSSIIIMFAMVFLLGCGSSKFKEEGTTKEGDNFINSKFTKFEGTKEKQLKLTKGKEVKFNFSKKVESGKLEVTVVDSKGNEVLKLDGSIGESNFKDVQDSKYVLKIKGEATNGEYNIKWSQQ